MRGDNVGNSVGARADQFALRGLQIMQTESTEDFKDANLKSDDFMASVGAIILNDPSEDLESEQVEISFVSASEGDNAFYGQAVSPVSEDAGPNNESDELLLSENMSTEEGYDTDLTDVGGWTEEDAVGRELASAFRLAAENRDLNTDLDALTEAFIMPASVPSVVDTVTDAANRMLVLGSIIVHDAARLLTEVDQVMQVASGWGNDVNESNGNTTGSLNAVDATILNPDEPCNLHSLALMHMWDNDVGSNFELYG